MLEKLIKLGIIINGTKISNKARKIIKENGLESEINTFLPLELELVDKLRYIANKKKTIHTCTDCDKRIQLNFIYCRKCSYTHYPSYNTKNIELKPNKHFSRDETIIRLKNIG